MWLFTVHTPRPPLVGNPESFNNINLFLCICVRLIFLCVFLNFPHAHLFIYLTSYSPASSGGTQLVFVRLDLLKVRVKVCVCVGAVVVVLVDCWLMKGSAEMGGRRRGSVNSDT